MVRDRSILTKFFTCTVHTESTGDFSQKITFSPFLAAILNFCVKHKNAFILETVRDRAISMKILTHRVSAECSGDITQNRFPAIYGGHLEFLRKMQKGIYLWNGESGILKFCVKLKKKMHIHLLVTFPKNRFPATSKFFEPYGY